MPRLTIRLSDDLLAVLTARVGQDTSVSDMVREALEAYLGVEPSQRPTSRQTFRRTRRQTTFPSSDSAPSVEEIVPQLAVILAEFQQRLTQIEARVDALSDTHRSPVRQRRRTPQPLPQGRDLDPQHWVLGKLCPRGHEYEHTGQTLWRLPGHHCRQCENELARERRQRRRANQTSANPA